MSTVERHITLATVIAFAAFVCGVIALGCFLVRLL